LAIAISVDGAVERQTSVAGDHNKGINNNDEMGTIPTMESGKMGTMMKKEKCMTEASMESLQTTYDERSWQEDS